jgi:predicted amidohydrolase YtcJ
VIWNKDLREVRTSRDILDLAPQATYLDGRPVYQAGG